MIKGINMIKIMSFFFILLITSCNHQPQLTLQSDSVILAFGDSLTVGVGVSKEFSYPSQLSAILKEKLPNHQLINSGVSGEVTKDGLMRLKNVLETVQPDLMILLEGGNDILRNKSFNTIKNNLEQMIVLAQQNNVQVILLGVPKKNLFASTASLYDELADEYELIYDGEIISDLIKDNSMKSDAVHFNKKGYRKLAERVYELIF